MSRAPDAAVAGRRKATLSVVLVAFVAALAVWAMIWGDRVLLERPPPPREAPLPAAGFAGASGNRLFLTAADSREASRRGLAPSGTRSILPTGGKLDFGEWRWDDSNVPPGPVTVRVDLGRQLVSVFQGRDEIGTAVIVYGADGKETPRGQLPILGKARAYHSTTYDAPMPYSLWLRGDGVALHGSSVSMGKATNGCIGVPVEFAGKLFAVARQGDIVEVIG